MEEEGVCPKGAWPVRGTSHLQDFAVATLTLCASVSHQEGISICTVHYSGKDIECTTAKMGLFGTKNM